jgi:hypothetical protein
MRVRLHDDALQRIAERGASEHEVISTIESGERFPAKSGRTGFRRSIEMLNANEQLQSEDKGNFVIVNQALGQSLEISLRELHPIP